MYEQARTSNLASVSLVFGILAWVALPMIGSLVAIVTGYMARKEIQQSRDRIQGDGLAVAGMILGWIQITLIAVSVIVAAFLFVGAITGSLLVVVIGLAAIFLMLTLALA